jgi:GTP-binding protein YchF
MPPKNKKKEVDDDAKFMRAARFGRVKNDLKMGFVGLPNVGKSTLTNLLAGACHAEAANYPFCTIDPNMVQAIVPDQKFKYLVDCWKPPSVVPAVLKIVDIAGLIAGASEGAGLGNAFLSHIAAVDGIFHLVRAFDSDEVIHVDDSVDPIRDLETIQTELCLKDKETLSKVVEKEKDRIRKEKGIARSADAPLGEVFQSAYDKCLKLIESNTPVQTHEDFSMGEVEVIRDFGLITTKPQIYVVNMSKKSFLRKGNVWLPKIQKWVNEHGGGQIIPMSCEFEQELFNIEDKEGQKAYIQECEDAVKAMGLTGPGFAVKSVVPRLIRSGRTALCLQSFYTAGPKEVRAWTIMKGTLAPQAAGVIHTDFERGFIKAEVANFDDFKALHEGQNSMAKVKEAGKYRQEGKTYVMAEGDIVVFMHNTTTAKKK